MNKVKVIGFAGLSESGKSHCGKYLEKNYNIPRVKIVKYFDELRSKFFDDLDIDQIHSLIYETDSKLSRYLIKKICLNIMKDYIDEEIIVIESLRNPVFGEVFKEICDDFIIVYIEADFLKRIEREKIKESLEYTETIKSVYEKDIIKESAGVSKYKQFSDYIYDNNGDINLLNQFLNDLITDI
jgi:dephospho-CoA kinase